MRPASEPAGGIEALGFPISNRLLGELEQMDLMEVETPPAAAVMVIEEEQGADTTGLVEQQRHAGRRVEQRHVTGEGLGASPTQLGKPWLPIQTIQTMASWLSETCP